MNTQKSNNIPQEAFDWYDEYAHGLIDRRTFMKKLGGLTALGFSMSVLTSALLPNYLLAEQVSFNDEGIKATYEEFDSPEGHEKCRASPVVPKNLNAKLPVVLVIHENRGKSLYWRCCKTTCKACFIAFAPDALFPLGAVGFCFGDYIVNYLAAKRIMWNIQCIYKDANHGFHNDSTARYDKANAELAWSRTIEFFNKKLI